MSHTFLHGDDFRKMLEAVNATKKKAKLEGRNARYRCFYYGTDNGGHDVTVGAIPLGEAEQQPTIPNVLSLSPRGPAST